MTRAVQEGTVAVGDAAAGRVRRAFEEAGDGRGVERGGDKNGGAREGELADLRRRCRKRLDVASAQADVLEDENHTRGNSGHWRCRRRESAPCI